MGKTKVIWCKPLFFKKEKNQKQKIAFIFVLRAYFYLDDTLYHLWV